MLTTEYRYSRLRPHRFPPYIIRNRISENKLAMFRPPRGWSRSNVFSRCPHCGGLSIRGVCQKCGYYCRCCVCKRIKQPDGTWRKMTAASTYVSDGICKECLFNYYPEIALVDKKGNVRCLSVNA